MKIISIISIIGFIGTVLSIIFQIPVIIKIIETKSVSSLSLSSYFLYTAASICWLIYGIYFKLWESIISCICTILMDIFIIYSILETNSMNKNDYINHHISTLDKKYQWRYL